MIPLYEICWPSAQQFFNPQCLEYNDQDLAVNYIVNFDINNIVAPEFVDYRGLQWSHLIYFKKQNISGSIHIDNTHLDDGKTLWGVNWVLDGHGIMEYWNQDAVTTVGVTAGSLNREEFGIVPKFVTTNPPNHRFILKKNHVYLINASVPHRAIGLGNRRLLSLRSHHWHWSWHEVVQRFLDQLH